MVISAGGRDSSNDKAHRRPQLAKYVDQLSKGNDPRVLAGTEGDTYQWANCRDEGHTLSSQTKVFIFQSNVDEVRASEAAMGSGA